VKTLASNPAVRLLCLRLNAVTTAQAAHYAGVHPGYFAAWARAHNLEPLHRRVRVGRSFVTFWSIESITKAGTGTAT
jgi:hypothetical protein